MLVQTRTGCTPVNRGAGHEEPDAQERRKGQIDQGPGGQRGSRDWHLGLIACGANESDQFFSSLFKNADLPEAALEGKRPPLFVVGGLLARSQQSIDGSWARGCGGVEPVSAWQLGDSGLLKEGKQGFNLCCACQQQCHSG